MRISEVLSKINRVQPLIHHLTNWVTISDCAAATRCCGALPVMAHEADEVEEMVRMASALVLNIGTLTHGLVSAMQRAAAAASVKGIPVILDAVGAGATTVRTAACRKLIAESRISVLKGNAAEIAALAGSAAEVRGVEGISYAGDIAVLCGALARTLGLTVVATGKEDIVSGAGGSFVVKNGHPLMADVVGTGCMSASVIAAFCAVEDDVTFASALALSYYGIAGEIAARRAAGPGTFKAHFFDVLAVIEHDEADRMMRVEEVVAVPR